MRWYITFAFLSLTLISGCSSEAQPVHNARILAFGTLIDVSIVGEPPGKAEAAVSQLEQEFQRMHQEWHAWDEGPVQHMNTQLQKGKSIEVPAPVLPLLKLSIPLAEQSEQLFNPAIGHLIARWGFQGRQGSCDTLPNKETIARLLHQNPTMDDLVFENKNGLLRSTNPAVKLDFGAVGKGYGIDQAMDILQKLGIHNALINAGGDLRAIGSHGGRPWRIAIRHPGGGVFGFVEVSGDESVFTSGNYERNYICNGQRYHHIIDPRSGYPARGTDSVTVIHHNAAIADAAATALFIAGPKDWQRIAQQMGISQVALLDDQGTLHLSPKMAKRLQLLNKSIKVEVSQPDDAKQP